MHRPLRRFLILLFLCLVPVLAWRPMVAAGAAPPREGFADLVERVRPAVVHLSVVKHQDREAAGSGSPDFFEDKLMREFFGDDQPAPRTGKTSERSHYGRGSGFVIDSNGYILTNAHVVARAERVSVVFADRQSFRAEIVGTDPQSDLALLRVDGRNLAVVAWGDSAALRAGDWAIAVGAARAVQTVTAGIVAHRPAQSGDQQLRRLHPDRCGHQPGQLGRAAGGRAGQGDRREHRLCRPGRRRLRHRLRGPGEHGPGDRRTAARGRPGGPRLAGCGPEGR